MNVFKEHVFYTIFLRVNANLSRSVSFFDQFKKSGKEPKAGAELVFGGTTYRTKV